MLRLSLLAFSTIVALLPACGPKEPATTDASTGADDSSGAPPPTSSSTPTGTSVEPATDTGGSPTSTSTTTGFESSSSAPVSDTDPVCSNRMLHETAPINVCDPFQQDCGACEKCNAYADDGVSGWNNNKCVPVAPDPAGVGEPCTTDPSGVSGFDDCDHGAMCWNVVDGQGTCVALCTGSLDTATCADPSKTCFVSQDLALILCLDRCDPLQADGCGANDVCVANPTGVGFLCRLDTSGDVGQVHTSCRFESCDPGLTCVEASAAAECDPDADGCCEPYCDLTVPDPDAQCPGVGQQCLPFFDPDPAPVGDEDVGVCRLPP